MITPTGVYKRQEKKQNAKLILSEIFEDSNLLSGDLKSPEHLARELEFFVAQTSRLFEAWKPVSGARVTGRIKIAETSVSGIDVSISSISL